MAYIETWARQEMTKPVKVQYLGGNLFSQDSQGNLLGVELYKDGVEYSGGGTVSGTVIRADGGTVAITGSISGNKAQIILPAAAYAVVGAVTIIIKLTQGGQTATIGAFVSMVYATSTDTIVDPGTIIPSIADLIAQIQAAVGSIPADYSALNQEVDDLKSAFAQRGIPSGGVSGQSLRKKSGTDYDLEWADVGLPTNAQTADAVSAWLDEHPEATTTVDFRIVTKTFGTVATMKADLTLQTGFVVLTTGYYTSGDGGGTLYKITDTEETVGAVALDNGLYANLMNIHRVNVLSLGCTRNTGTDVTPIILAAITFKEANAENEPMTLFFPAGTYFFSPLKIQANGISLEGEGNPFSSNKRFLSTTFCPVGSQRYIIMMGSDDTDQYKNAYVYTANAIKNIQFCCNKFGTTSRHGTGNNWQITEAMLIIFRQYMSEFNDLAFYYSYGTALKLASSWECFFGGNTMFRNIFAPSKGAFLFGTDFLGVTTVSDTSSIFFNNLEFEAIAGNYMNFENNCNVENNIFGSIMCEDYRIDMPDRPQSDRWGTEWTDRTWLPDGVSAPDVELAIFNFETGAYFSNNTINNITCSMYAVRSYYLDGVLYTHDALVKCEGFPRRFGFQCSLVNIQANRTNIKTLINKFIGTPRIFNFNIESLIMNDNVYTAELDGIARNYFVNLRRQRLPLDYVGRGMSNAIDYTGSSAITISSTDVIPAETTVVFAPLATWDADAYADGHICYAVPNRSVYPTAGAISAIRIPIIGNTLHAHIYMETADSMIYTIYDLTGETQLKVGNFATYSAGWNFVTIDTSQYVGAGFVSLANRVNKTENITNLVDVLYWT